MTRKLLAKPLPEAVRALVQRAHEDEARHLAWIEGALARAAWYGAPGAASCP